MANCIDRDAAIAIIEEKQKELCPVGRYGRGYVYGPDREKYDAWDEIIDALENVPAVDVAPVVHARWIDGKCSNCGVDIPTDDAHDVIFGHECRFCYYCGAKMDGGDDHAST